MTAPIATGATAFCHRCQRDTPSGLLLLSGGHTGNVCCDCRATRKGKPFVSFAEYQRIRNLQPMPPPAEGHHERTATQVR